MILDANTHSEIFGRRTFNRRKNEIGQKCVPVTEFDPFVSGSSRMILLFASRCGSSYFCKLLANTKNLGRPGELFSTGNINRFRDRLSTETLNETMKGIYEGFQTKNGAFVTKIGRLELSLFYAIEEFPRNVGRWHFSHMWREDVLSQAISLYKLSLNQQHSTLVDPLLEVKESDYDANKIARSINNILNSNKFIEAFYRMHGINYFRFSYEDLLRDPGAMVKKFGEFMGVDVPDFNVGTNLNIQRDELSEAWRDRFIADMRRANWATEADLVEEQKTR